MLLCKLNNREKGEVPAPTHQELPVREGKQTPGALKLSFLYLQPPASSPATTSNLFLSSELSSSCAIVIPALSFSL